MITGILLKFVTFLMNALAWMLPSWSFPSNFSYAIAKFFDYIWMWDGIFPIEYWFDVLLVWISFEASMLAIKISLFIISFIKQHNEI